MLTHSKYEVYFVIDDEDEEHDSEKVSFNPSKEPPNATEWSRIKINQKLSFGRFMA